MKNGTLLQDKGKFARQVAQTATVAGTVTPDAVTTLRINSVLVEATTT